MMERSERTDPTAKHTTKNQREREQAHAPQKPAIHGVRRKRGHRGDEWIREQKRFDGKRKTNGLIRLRCERSAKRSLEKEIHEDGEEPDLRCAPHPFQNSNALS